uniref:Uncharacterized protein n=1 Tax=Strigamia maritima TaxID=126957 RepID=T1IYQ3_STRMM
MVLTLDWGFLGTVALPQNPLKNKKEKKGKCREFNTRSTQRHRMKNNKNEQPGTIMAFLGTYTIPIENCHTMLKTPVLVRSPKLSSIGSELPYHAENTGSRPIPEVKQHRVWLVLGWVTAWESQM